MSYFGVYRAPGSVTTWSAHARYTILISGLDDRNPAGPEDSLRRWVVAGGKIKRRRECVGGVFTETKGSSSIERDVKREWRWRCVCIMVCRW